MSEYLGQNATNLMGNVEIPSSTRVGRRHDEGLDEEEFDFAGVPRVDGRLFVVVDEFVQRRESPLSDVENAIDKPNSKMFIFTCENEYAKIKRDFIFRHQMRSARVLISEWS